MRRVATLVARNAPPAEVFETVSREAGRLVGADGAGLTRYEPDGTAIALGRWAHTTGYIIDVGTRFVLEPGTVSTLVFDTRRPGRIHSYEGVPASLVVASRQAGLRSAVGAPVVVDGRLWGAVTVFSTSDRPFPVDTEARLAAFTELVATAIANTERSRGAQVAG